MNARRLSIVFATSLALGACTVGPDFVRPDAPRTDRYGAAPTPTRIDEAQRFDAALDMRADWWTLFHSPELDRLVAEALAHSPDLASADAALRAARENVLAQRGAFLPTVEGQFSSTRQSTARTLSSALDSNDYLYNLHTAQLTIGYAPDVFGGNRRQVESLEAQAEAQRDALLAARLTLTGNLVCAVIQRASLRTQIATTHALVDSAERQRDLVRRSRELGQVGADDVATQELALAQDRALLPPLEKQLAQADDLVAVLTGRLPSDGTPSSLDLEALVLPDALPLALPSSLVERRPDVLAATAQLHAASAQIGVAVANRLPDITLTAGAGSSALLVSRLATSGTGFWSLGANVVQPLFDGGTLLHRERAARALYEQSAAQYRGTVLLAFQNVADTLAALEADARTLAASRAAERAASRSLDIARAQRAVGNGNGLAVLVADQAFRQATLTRIQAEAARLTDTVALFQALGGGWWNDRAASAAR